MLSVFSKCSKLYKVSDKLTTVFFSLFITVIDFQNYVLKTSSL